MTRIVTEFPLSTPSQRYDAYMPPAVPGAVNNVHYTERPLFPSAVSERTCLRLAFPLSRAKAIFTLSL